MKALACALASALLFFLALGTPNAWPLMWIAPVPLLWLALGHASWQRVALASLAAYLLGELGMLWPYLHVMGAVVVVAALGPAVAFMLIVLATRFSARRLPMLAATLVFPTLWTGFEFLSASLSPHGTFGMWAYSQISAPVMLQSASLFGPWVVSFLIAYVAAGIALALRRFSLSPLVLPFALACVNLAFGMWRLSELGGATLRVGAAARDHDDARTASMVAADEAAEVRRLAALGARVVVFDEKAALLPAAQRDSVLAPLVAAARETHTRIVAGFDVTGAERRNAAFTIDESGRISTYTKRHHIPGLESGYTVGSGPGLLGAGESVVICKDMDFQSTLRNDAVAAAFTTRSLDLMLVPAWDFNTDGWLHARIAVLRGVEGGYAIVRSAANGLVTVSDSRGRMLGLRRSGKGAYESVVVDVPRVSALPLYVWIGDVFAWIAGLAGLALFAWSVRRREP